MGAFSCKISSIPDRIFEFNYEFNREFICEFVCEFFLKTQSSFHTQQKIRPGDWFFWFLASCVCVCVCVVPLFVFVLFVRPASRFTGVGFVWCVCGTYAFVMCARACAVVCLYACV